MKNKEEDKKIIFDEIDRLKIGNKEERLFAFECIGILGNESTTESYENRIRIVKRKIEEFNNKNHNG